MWLIQKEKQAGGGNAKIKNGNVLSDKQPESKAPLRKNYRISYSEIFKKLCQLKIKRYFKSINKVKQSLFIKERGLFPKEPKGMEAWLV